MENFLKLSMRMKACWMLWVVAVSMKRRWMSISVSESEAGHNDNGRTTTQTLPVRASQALAPPVPTKVEKKQIVDSWEEEVSDDDQLDGNDAAEVFTGATEVRKTTGKKERLANAQSNGQLSREQPARDMMSHDPGSILIVLKMFRMLKAEFDEKFKTMGP